MVPLGPSARRTAPPATAGGVRCPGGPCWSGYRFNHPLRVRKWLPVVTAMPRMMKVLGQHPELGCLGSQGWFGRTTLLLQYWRDFESLNRFSRDKELPHLEPWRQFNRAVRDSGDVGIWHETFRVRAGE
jgi:Domain of unknown function (DUF4188)